MASRADQMASGINFSKFGKADDLKKRIWFTLGALIIFRMLSFVPLPGVDPVAQAALYANNAAGGVLDIFNTFSGGSLERMSLIALGVMPYITASIVVQLAASLSPTLAAIKKEGESGRKKLNQYTRYGTVFLTAMQGFFLASGLETLAAANGIQAVVEPGLMFRVVATISLVGGTMFLMWLGEQITSRGIGNGISLIIMAGIVAQMPRLVANLLEGGRTGSIDPIIIVGFIAMFVFLTLLICYVERAQRRVLIQYPKRATQRGMMQADRSHLPLKLNTAGVIPPIFASSLLLLPITVSQLGGQTVAGESQFGDFIILLNQYLSHGQPVYLLLYGLGIVFFCFFYTAVVFNPEETADNLKKAGGFIPGIRPGKSTQDYLDYVLTRITVLGAAYLAVVCLLPDYVMGLTGQQQFFVIGGTSLLILVNVTVDTISQIQGHLIAHQYGDLLKKAKLKGNRGR
ncbi:preprotein translocase subunit SecY [Sphingorhabdus sp.]|jgi:preprotein translocase subunit SecY|uniref:preprotein translocase subunit SecY n=1 Tax=Sphingorhabdus sp. TaxID=1902408 RepID=UPI003BAF9F02|nr:preprotein translocase subunit SecY [Sphingomonadales bacterium]MBK9431118.1 preprotein translocase subunit SecY [Sphingomonadales bacterium]MBL0021256.1 preprotein translocase subunit SecY [Sphingomonadales bacterium]